MPLLQYSVNKKSSRERCYLVGFVGHHRFSRVRGVVDGVDVNNGRGFTLPKRKRSRCAVPCHGSGTRWNHDLDSLSHICPRALVIVKKNIGDNALVLRIRTCVAGFSFTIQLTMGLVVAGLSVRRCLMGHTLAASLEETWGEAADCEQDVEVGPCVPSAGG